MSSLLYDLCARVLPVLAWVGVGTNLGLLQIFFALVSGRFLANRGALLPALADCGLSDEAVRRSVPGARLRALEHNRPHRPHGRRRVRAERHWHPHCYGGFRPVAVDLAGFFRAQVAGGRLANTTRPVPTKPCPRGCSAWSPRWVLVGQETSAPPARAGTSGPTTRPKVTCKTGSCARPSSPSRLDEVIVVDAGFSIEELLQHPECRLRGASGPECYRPTQLPARL